MKVQYGNSAVADKAHVLCYIPISPPETTDSKHSSVVKDEVAEFDQVSHEEKVAAERFHH